MRPNLAQDAPPAAIVVGGSLYNADTDYRTWLEVLRLMRNIIADAETDEQKTANTETVCQIQTLVFGGVLAEEDPGETMQAVAEFAQGYPEPPVSAGRDTAPTYSFEYDVNYIILAIRNQSGTDLSYRRREPFHWWEFLLEFRSLCGEHYILRLMEIRGYTGKDKDMLRQRARFALPRAYTAKEKAALEDVNNEFYGAV